MDAATEHADRHRRENAATDYGVARMSATCEWSRWDEGGPTALPPDLTPWLPFGEPHCGATNSRGLICTRLPGHTGRHAAGDGDFIVAVWGDPA